jgi:peptide/nickel transport system substrate-binding protein
VFKQPRVDIDQAVGLRELSILPEGVQGLTKYAGAGPFELVSWRPGQRGEWRRYDGFFLSGQPYVDELETIGIEEAQARLNALLGASGRDVVGSSSRRPGHRQTATTSSHPLEQRALLALLHGRDGAGVHRPARAGGDEARGRP